MQVLFKNKLIILLLCVIALFLALHSDKQQALPLAAKQQTTDFTSNAAGRAVIKPNPEQRSTPQNPFKTFVSHTAPTMNADNSSLALMGTVAQNNEFMAIIAVQGKSDFYRPNQKLLEYTIQEINSTSAVLYNEHTKQRSILHIKE